MLSGIDCGDDLISAHKPTQLSVEGRVKKRLRYPAIIHAVLVISLVTFIIMDLVLQYQPWCWQRIGVLFLQLVYVVVAGLVDLTHFRLRFMRRCRSLLFFGCIVPLTCFNTIAFWTLSPHLHLDQGVYSKVFAYVTTFLLVLIEWIFSANVYVKTVSWTIGYAVSSVLTGFTFVWAFFGSCASASTAHIAILSGVGAALSLAITVGALWTNSMYLRQGPISEWLTSSPGMNAITFRTATAEAAASRI